MRRGSGSWLVQPGREGFGEELTKVSSVSEEVTKKMDLDSAAGRSGR